LEGVAVDTIISMVMKLSESSFKPFLFKVSCRDITMHNTIRLYVGNTMELTVSLSEALESTLEGQMILFIRNTLCHVLKRSCNFLVYTKSRV